MQSSHQTINNSLSANTSWEHNTEWTEGRNFHFHPKPTLSNLEAMSVVNGQYWQTQQPALFDYLHSQVQYQFLPQSWGGFLLDIEDPSRLNLSYLIFYPCVSVYIADKNCWNENWICALLAISVSLQSEKIDESWFFQQQPFNLLVDIYKQVFKLKTALIFQMI